MAIEVRKVVLESVSDASGLAALIDETLQLPEDGEQTFEPSVNTA